MNISKNLSLLSRSVLALLLGAAAATSTSAQLAPGAKPRTVVPVFWLHGAVAEVPPDDTFAMFGTPALSLKDLVARLGKAAVDPEVKAVVIVPDTESLGMAQVEELRQAMAVVRSHDKEVYVHADSLGVPQYALACGASQIAVVPTGDVMVPGLITSSLHIRGLLDKIGVKPDFLTEGAYKSAAELFMREQPSPEADQMMNWLIDSDYASLTAMIAQGRKVDAAKVKEWLDTGIFTADQAKAAGLINVVEHRPDIRAMLKEKFGNDIILDTKYGREQQPQMDLSSPLALFKIWGELLSGPKKKDAPKPAVGIVYVDGEINLGKSKANPFGGSQGAYSTDIRQALEKAAGDDSIKAVVLRVNSPGGSATASEIILDATKRVKAKKPLVVSMGNVAGSGGYYVACAADTIYADATTLTGSIGVLGGKLATTEMWKKVGITFKEYKRGQNAGILSSEDIFTESERARMKVFMDETYAVFKSHVTDIRGSRLKKPIDELAGGRVYTGQQALELGLVDRIGTMSDAVTFAAEQAKIKDYDVRIVPEPKNFIEELMEQISGGTDSEGKVQMAASEESLLKLAAPYLVNLDPRRVAAVTSALQRLEILQKEGVVLSMPEIIP